jgi:hypothetical protein
MIGLYWENLKTIFHVFLFTKTKEVENLRMIRISKSKIKFKSEYY